MEKNTEPQRGFGLIGYPLGHSFSKAFFSEKFKTEGLSHCTYALYPLSQIDALPPLLAAQPLLCGLNVTIPYKKTVIPYLNSCTPEAQAIGAVNCIARTSGGLIGANTDVLGFEASLLGAVAVPAGQFDRALILGTGGAAAAVAYVLRKLNLEYDLVSRNPTATQLSYDQANVMLRTPKRILIVQTTPVGMAPNIEYTPPLNFNALNERHFVFDLIYNPKETLLLSRAKERGASVLNGLEMLHLQAEAAWQFWMAHIEIT